MDGFQRDTLDWSSFDFGAVETDGATFNIEPDPISNQSPDRIIADADSRSLLIMICSRLDKIEIIMEKVQGTSEATKDVALQAVERVNNMAPGITQAIEVLEKLRKDMGVFTKALVRYVQQLLRGDDQAGMEGSSDFETDV